MPLNPNTLKSIVTHTGVALSALIAALALIMPWEGKVNVGYRDIVGVSTDCYGHTGPDVKVGVRKTDAECETELAMDVVRVANGIQLCIKVPVPDKSMGAFISLAYNIGSGGFCRSALWSPQAAREHRPQGLVWQLNHGDLAGACARISAYTNAGGKFSQGLANRRVKERALCEKGLVA